MLTGIDRQALQFIDSFKELNGREPDAHEMRGFYARHLQETFETHGVSIPVFSVPEPSDGTLLGSLISPPST